MATYNGWTEVREYRVWMGDELYASVTVDKHSNGWFNVSADGSDDVYKTRSESCAYRAALSDAEAIVGEAVASCTCGESADECGRFHGGPHGVRMNVYDSTEGRELEPYEL